MLQPETSKHILRLFTYGLFVASSTGPDGPRAATISWVTQVSFEPQLVAVAMRKETAICQAVYASRRFVLHVAGSDQPEFAKAFFKVATAGPAEIAGYKFTLSSHGLPIFDAASAWLECEVVEEAGQSGDHMVFIARILTSSQRGQGMTALALRDTPWHYGG